MTFFRSAFSDRFLESGRPLYGPGRYLRDAASADVSEDSGLELDDGEDGEPGDSPESDHEEEVLSLEELASFAADMLAFSTGDVERASLVSLRIIRNCWRSLRSRSRRSVAWPTDPGREENDSPPLGSILTLDFLFVLRREVSTRDSHSMSSGHIASPFASSQSFSSAHELLAACWAVRRRRSISTSALRLPTSSGWPEASAFNASDSERKPPRALASCMFVRTPPGGT